MYNDIFEIGPSQRLSLCFFDKRILIKYSSVFWGTKSNEEYFIENIEKMMKQMNG